MPNFRRTHLYFANPQARRWGPSRGTVTPAAWAYLIGFLLCLCLFLSPSAVSWIEIGVIQSPLAWIVVASAGLLVATFVPLPASKASVDCRRIVVPRWGPSFPPKVPVVVDASPPIVISRVPPPLATIADPRFRKNERAFAWPLPISFGSRTIGCQSDFVWEGGWEGHRRTGVPWFPQTSSDPKGGAYAINYITQ